MTLRHLRYAFFFLASFLFLTPIASSKTSAATYYLSPTGNDSNNGSSSTPWQTITKANSIVTSGDTVMFKDGTYPVPISPTFRGYIINKSGTTWKAENKHKAILDGGMGPELFPQSGGPVANQAPIIYKAKFPTPTEGFYTYAISLNDVTDVTIDGLVVANTPGRSIQVVQSTAATSIKNITIKNSWFDFVWGPTFLVAIGLHGNEFDRSQVQNLTFENNWVTRGGVAALGYYYGYPTFGGWPGNYVPAGGKNVVTRNNVFAWSWGETGAHRGSTNHTFENNITINNFIGYYVDKNQNTVVRNNLMVLSNELLNPDVIKRTGWGLVSGGRGIESTREDHPAYTPADFINKNTEVYNNILIGPNIIFSGKHYDVALPQEGVYIGHNTLVGLPHTNTFAKEDEPGGRGTMMLIPHFSKEKPIKGIIENNLFVTDQLPVDNKKRVVNVPLTADAFQVSSRNNLFPLESKAMAGPLFGEHTVANSNAGVVNPNAPFEIKPPGNFFAPRGDFGAKVQADVDYSKAYVANLHLKVDSLARDAGSIVGAANGVTPPSGARARDFLGNVRDSKPDIGAIEFNGSQATPPPTSWDLNQDGKVNIFDWSYFVKGFGSSFGLSDISKFVQNLGI